jgi:hypothetical protein
VAAPPRKKSISANTLLAAGVAGCAVLIVVAIVSLRFLQREPPPPPPPPPPAPEASVGRILRYSPGYYKATLDEDAKRYKLATVDPAAIAQPLPYADELSQPRRLKVEKDAIETPHLRVTTRVANEWASTDTGQRFRFEHIILSITNRTNRPLAYQVQTRIDHPEHCRSSGAMAHNALALRPGETVQRTECLWHKDAQLIVDKIEVLELPQLGYFYVSRLLPVQVGLDERTAAGHTVPPPAKECSFVPWRDIQASHQSVHTGWSDVIDFYARHNCDEYSYFRGYRRWTAPGSLPARADAADPVDRGAASK